MLYISHANTCIEKAQYYASWIILSSPFLQNLLIFLLFRLLINFHFVWTRSLCSLEAKSRLFFIISNIILGIISYWLKIFFFIVIKLRNALILNKLTTIKYMTTQDWNLLKHYLSNKNVITSCAPSPAVSMSD